MELSDKKPWGPSNPKAYTYNGALAPDRQSFALTNSKIANRISTLFPL